MKNLNYYLIYKIIGKIAKNKYSNLKINLV